MSRRIFVLHELATPLVPKQAGHLLRLMNLRSVEFILLERGEEVVCVHQQDDKQPNDKEKLQTPVQTAKLEWEEAQHVRALARQGRGRGVKGGERAMNSVRDRTQWISITSADSSPGVPIGGKTSRVPLASARWA